jgi:hypothetical protein
MNSIRFATLALLFTICGVAQTQSAQNNRAPGSDKDRLIGAWHLVSIAGPDGKLVTGDLPVGMLVYTRDGHMSVQLMYPKSATTQSNEYVKNGYEASFGGYDVDGKAHTITHHVSGSNTGDLLVGKDLPRVYEFGADGHLIIRSARSDEHWSVQWAHY